MRWTLLALLLVTAALAVPALALGDDAPNPAAAACKAEYIQLGADAFKAKYGATEAYGNCLKAHGGTAAPPTTTTRPTTTTPAPTEGTGPEAACKAEYVQLGADAFKAKYGATEAYGNCLKAHGGTAAPPTTTTRPTEGAGPEAACKAEYVQLGAAAFIAKYGAKEAFGACVKAHATAKPKPDSKGKDSSPAAGSVAQALCTAEGRSLGKDAFQAKYGQGKDGLAACVKAALGRAQSILAACSSSTSGDAFKQCVLAALKGARAR